MNNAAMLIRRQEETVEQMEACLQQFGMCNVERPTGFGKTKLFMDYAKRHEGKKMLYIYDLKSTAQNVIHKYNPKDMAFTSYAMLSRRDKRAEAYDWLTDKQWHTIIFDESHLMGGKNIRKLLDEAMPKILENGTRVLGGTATVVRTDTTDVTLRFFQGHTTNPYGLVDALNDGVMLQPEWALAVARQECIKDLGSKLPKDELHSKILNQLNLSYANMQGVDSIYYDVVKEVYGTVPDQMLFIVFYPTIEAIEDNKVRVAKDFQRAFPGWAIYAHALSSDIEHYNSIGEVEEQIKPNERRVDLIFAVNMLNQSYHSDRLTGVVMNRKTFSDIIVTQQLGRVLSVTAKMPGIVFDNVCNAQMAIKAVAQATGAVGGGDDEHRGRPAGKREPSILKLKVTKQIADMTVWYKRVMATASINREQVDFARKMKREYGGAPDDVVEKFTGVPAWLFNSDV